MSEKFWAGTIYFLSSSLIFLWLSSFLFSSLLLWYKQELCALPSNFEGWLQNFLCLCFPFRLLAHPHSMHRIFATTFAIQHEHSVLLWTILWKVNLPGVHHPFAPSCQDFRLSCLKLANFIAGINILGPDSSWSGFGWKLGSIPNVHEHPKNIPKSKWWGYIVQFCTKLPTFSPLLPETCQLYSSRHQHPAMDENGSPKV